MMKYLSQLVRNARIGLGLTQEEVAAKLEMRPNNYNQHETGKRPITPGMVQRLVKILDLPVDPSREEVIEILAKYEPEEIKEAYAVIERTAG